MKEINSNFIQRNFIELDQLQKTNKQNCKMPSPTRRILAAQEREMDNRIEEYNGKIRHIKNLVEHMEKIRDNVLTDDRKTRAIRATQKTIERIREEKRKLGIKIEQAERQWNANRRAHEENARW